MQQRVSVKCRLLDTSHSDETETIVKRVFWHSAFFKHIVECPVRHHFHQAIALRDVVAQRWTNINAVAGAEVTIRGNIPLSPEQRELRTSRSLDLLLHLLDGAADTLVHRNLLVGVKQIFDGVIAVAVAGDKVDRYVLLRDVSEERLDPIGCGSRRPANA